jgi:hypothetical protein
VADTYPDGVWIDTTTGAVVLTPPVEGVQIVAPGTPVPDGERARLEALLATVTPARKAAPKAAPAEDTEAPEPKPRARTRKA